MPVTTYDDETHNRMVRMHFEHLDTDGDSNSATRRKVGGLLGIKESTLRNWVRKAQSWPSRHRRR